MNTTSIQQSTSNWWTQLSLLMVFIMLGGSSTIALKLWPPTFNMKWLVLSCVWAGSLWGVVSLSIWVFKPRQFSIEITDKNIKISQSIFAKVKTELIEAKNIKTICHRCESGSYLETKDGKTYDISDLIMMKRNELFEAVNKIHPHIQCVSDAKNVFKKIS